MAKIVAGVWTSHVPAIGAALDLGKTRRALLAARLRRLREIEGMDREGEARRVHRRLQRSRDGLLGRHRADLRARLRGGIPARRRRLGPAPRAGGEGASRTCRAHRAIGHPGRFRPDGRQQDGSRPRPHRAAEPHVRPAEGMAVQDHSAGRERGAVPAAERQALLQSRPRDPQGRREPIRKICAS